MRKLVNPLPAGGAPIFTEQLNDVLGSELWYAIERLALDTGGNNGPQIVTGGTVTGADMSAGLVILDGNLLRFPATVANVWPVYIEAAPVTIEQKEYADAVLRDLIEVRLAVVTGVLPVASHVVITGVAETDKYKYIRNYLAKAPDLDAANSAIGAEEAARIAADGVIQADVDANQTASESADGTLQTNINNEANSRIAGDDALELAKMDKWFNTVSVVSLNDGGVTGQFRSRMDGNGIVHYSGSVKNLSGATYSNNTSIGQGPPAVEGNGTYALTGFVINTGGDINTGSSIHKTHLYESGGDTRIQMVDVGDQTVITWQGSYPTESSYV